MIALNRRTKIFVCKDATDMRASYDSLFSKVKSILKKDPFSGHLFLFVNQKRTTCKCLYYDGTGLVILSKRLEKGTFSRINPLYAGEIVLTEAEFGLFFEGAHLEKRFIDSPSEIKNIQSELITCKEMPFIQQCLGLAPQNLSKRLSRDELKNLSPEVLIQIVEHLQEEKEQWVAYAQELADKVLLIEGQYVTLKNKFFGKSSEKKPTLPLEKRVSSGKKKEKKVQLPSLRYPDAPLIERHIEFKEVPNCSCCGALLRDTGMTEDAEYLTVSPKKYLIVRQKRHKYSCGKCYSEVKTAPVPIRITPSSSFSDEMTIDVALSKYCDLVPIERYAAIAGRQGLKDLPPQSLIELTHRLADFVKGAYECIKIEVLKAHVLLADETPHRMLEGHEKMNWFLWGFSTANSSYFEIRDTRSGEVASDLLTSSSCQYLVSDVFSGYGKAVRAINKERISKHQAEIQNVYCNAHSRRKFKEAENIFPDESKCFVEKYEAIYHLEKQVKLASSDEALQKRSEMIPIFEAMKAQSEAIYDNYSSQSTLAKAISYFIDNYKELTLFTQNISLPIDNNAQERQLRSPVVGRKTWYGTHSERGAETAAILFSLVESCKLNQINPREYFKNLVQDLHDKKNPYSPYGYKSKLTSKEKPPDPVPQ